ncbi:hypothetical protein [Ancylobacter pratisalsi]|uniref:hypothetical protein n=1 Tax=Ancylobacter pratisalsi TaxID=1745854 RepID=UPI001AEEB98D|nr:hypothetical protein [Ancylobacter pratisalsi]
MLAALILTGLSVTLPTGGATAQARITQNGSSPAPAIVPPAPPPPLVLLLDGLGVYVESDYIGLSALARPLRQQGFRTRTDSHLMTKTQGLVPDVIIGHSMGGDMALRYARKLVAAGQPAPFIITIDAAPAPPACPVPNCINIHGPGFANVRGALNIDAWASGAKFVTHAQLPTNPVVESIILDQTSAYLKKRAERLAPPPSAEEPAAAASAPAPARPAPPPASPPAAATAPSGWQKPAWKLPSWTSPNWNIPGREPDDG